MPLPPSMSPDESLGHDGPAIVFQRRIPGWLRLVSLIFVVPLAVSLPIYVSMARETDWAQAQLAGVVVMTLLMVVLPLIFAGGALVYALRLPSARLRLDPQSGTALLSLEAPLRRRQLRYPLSQIEIVRTELQEDHPVHETPGIVLRMPDGRQIAIRCFFRDQDAKNWGREIGRLIGGETSGGTSGLHGA